MDDSGPGRAERFGLAPPGTAASQAEALPSRIVHAGHRHSIISELTGNWQGRPAVVFDLNLATDYGGRGEDAAGVVTGRFHVGAIALPVSCGWWAVTRPDIREHLPQAGRRTRLPGTRRLERVWMLTDPGVVPSVTPEVMGWVSRQVAGRRIGRYPLSALEAAGSGSDCWPSSAPGSRQRQAGRPAMPSRVSRTQNEALRRFRS